MEFAMLDKLVFKCREKNVSEIIGYYYQTSKNKMVFDLYENFGFVLNDSNGEDTIWKLDISNYKNKNKIIKIAK